MKTEYIEEFVVLAGKLSFTSAAASLHISHSALTRHIQALEEELGATLVSRSTHSVSLTPEGIEFLAHARKIASELDLATTAIRSIATGETGKLSFGALYYAIDNFASPILSEAARKLPNLEIDIRSYQPDTLLDALLSGAADVAPTCYRYDGLPNARYLHFADDGLCVLCRKESEISKRQMLELEDLNGLTLIAPKYDLRYGIQAEYVEALGKAGANVTEPSSCKNVDLVPSFVRTTGNPSVIQSCMSSMGANGLTCIPISRRQVSCKMYLAYLADNDNPSIQRFVDLAKSLYPNSNIE